MDDRELRELLHRLPRESAPPGLSARLAGRLDAADRRIQARRRAAPVLAFAAALVLVAGTALLYTWQQRRAESEARVEQARLAGFEHEYRDIKEELVELQRLVASAQPVVGVEGPGERGYVIDVGALARASADGAVPMAYRLPH